MTINWMTLLAQIANFLVLVWMLKRFLYEPVRRMIAEREQKMTAHLRRGEVMQEEAREKEHLYESKIREFEEQREQLLRTVRQEAEQLRRRLHDEAVQEANKARELLVEELRQDEKQFEQTLQEHVLAQTCEIAGNVVRDLTHRRLEGALIAVLEEKVAETDETPGGGVSTGGADDQTDRREAVVVRTSFEPTEAEKERLTTLAIKFAGHSRVDAELVVDPTLILGVELISTSEAVSWSARDYINCLQEVAFDRLVRTMSTDQTGAVAGD